MQLLNFLFFPHSLPLTKVSHSLLYSLRTPISLHHCINVHLFSARMHCSHLSTMLFSNASHQYASPNFRYLHYAMHIITKWGDSSAHYALPTLYLPTIQNPHFASQPQIFLLKISQLCICSLCISSLGISSLCTSPHYASPLTMHLPSLCISPHYTSPHNASWQNTGVQYAYLGLHQRAAQGEGVEYKPERIKDC